LARRHLKAGIFDAHGVSHDRIRHFNAANPGLGLSDCDEKPVGIGKAFMPKCTCQMSARNLAIFPAPPPIGNSCSENPATNWLSFTSLA
jgi:hypothetical protein